MQRDERVPAEVPLQVERVLTHDSGRDLFGFGVNWGQPNATTWGEGLDDQVSFELFWRWFLGEQLALTPDLQYLINPAVNPDEDSVWMFGLRGRLAM